MAARALARRRTAAAAAAADRLWSALETQPDGRPTVVAFSTRGCAECRLQAGVLRTIDGLRVLAVDAGQRPHVAGAFGVLTAPSTAVLRGDGSLVTVNHGFADGDRLRRQLAQA